jgi:hypothetical protein
VRYELDLKSIKPGELKVSHELSFGWYTKPFQINLAQTNKHQKKIAVFRQAYFRYGSAFSISWDMALHSPIYQTTRRHAQEDRNICFM